MLLSGLGIYEFKTAMWDRNSSNIPHLCSAYESYFGDDEKLEMILDKLQIIQRDDGNVTANVTLLFMDWDHAIRFLHKAVDYQLESLSKFFPYFFIVFCIQ